jgi:hypothetical protein
VLQLAGPDLGWPGGAQERGLLDDEVELVAGAGQGLVSLLADGDEAADTACGQAGLVRG